MERKAADRIFEDVQVQGDRRAFGSLRNGLQSLPI